MLYKNRINIESCREIDNEFPPFMTIGVDINTENQIELN